jgi:hypothetical protein
MVVFFIDQNLKKQLQKKYQGNEYNIMASMSP